jgi:beta-lactamase class A
MLAIGTVLVIGLLALILQFVLGGQSSAPDLASENINSTQKVDEEQATKPEFEFINLQPLVDDWAKKTDGTKSVVIYDLNNNKQAAAYEPNKQYFTASIYKLYVAYIGYQKIADGTYDKDELYLNGWTRLKCLDEMIRSSNSPCAEKMWNELGKENITALVSKYGIKNTSLSGLVTSANDSTILLKRLHSGDDLTDEHRKLFLDSMLNQPAKYRVGLPSGFDTTTKVYNKVGWNLDLEWHDTAIITLNNNRSYIISVLTKGTGRNSVVSLATKLKLAINN